MIPGATPSRVLRFENMQSLVDTGYKSGSGTLTASNGILTAYSPSLIDAAWASIPVYSPRGTVIEVSCQARQDTATSQGRIFIDQYKTTGTSERTTLDYVYPESTDWEPIKITFAGNDIRPYSQVRMGVTTTTTGRIHFKSITVTVYNIASPSPDYRSCMIWGVNGVWNIDDQENRFTNIGCYKIRLIDNAIRVFYEPMQSWGRPVATAQMDIIGGSYKYHLAVSSVMKDQCDILIIDSTNGTVINPRTVNGNSWISLMAIGI